MITDKKYFLNRLNNLKPELFKQLNFSQFIYSNYTTKSIVLDKYKRSFYVAPKDLITYENPLSIRTTVCKENFIKIELLKVRKQLWFKKFHFKNFNYKTGTSKVIIVDEFNNEFEISFDHLIKLEESPSILSAIDKSLYMIFKAKSIHGNKYDYNKSKFTDCHAHNVSINCSMHGDFITSYQSHITHKSGCPECGRILQCGNYSGVARDFPNRKTFLYLVKLQSTNTDEIFYKIGLTKNMKKRKTQFGTYKTEIIELIEGTSSKLRKKEVALHAALNELKLSYFPKCKFGGYTECFRW